VPSSSCLNLHAPRFRQPSYSFSVVENVRRPLSLVNVSATDVDSGLGGQFTIRALNFANVSDTFTYNNETGEVVLVGQLDARNVSRYVMHFTVTDHAFPYRANRTVVTVDVTEENPPVFDPSTYTFVVPEWTDPPFALGVIEATDADGGADNDVVFAIESRTDSPNPLVSLNTTSGELQMVRRPNTTSAEQRLTTRLVVSVIDGVFPFRSGCCANLSLSFTEHTAEFAVRQYAAEIPENATVGTRVFFLTTQATDRNRSVTFFFTKHW